MVDNFLSGKDSCFDDHDVSALPPTIVLEKILSTTLPLSDSETEKLPLLKSLDRILSEDIFSNINVPQYKNAAMDGYALNSADLPETGTQILTVIGNSFAGHPFLGQSGKNECVRIMTGAVLPDNTDTVIPFERLETLDQFSVRIDNRIRAGENVRNSGEDIKQGQTILRKGKKVGASELGILASAGIPEIKVMRRLKVAFFSTGDELRDLGEPLQKGDVYDSNRYTLFGMLSHQHCEITDLGVIPDNEDELHAVLKKCKNQFDVIISTGGVSVGEADLVRHVFSELGELSLWKVAIKPGRPLTFGHLGKSLFFGLPGNPVAVMVSFYLFIKPTLQQLSGENIKPNLILQAVTTSALNKRAGRTEYQRGIFEQHQDGTFNVNKTGEQGSGILTSMSQANCFIILDANQTKIEAGALVNVLPFICLY